MDITGKLWISKSKNSDGFYATIKDGKSDAKVFMSVGFKRGEEPADGCEIEISRGFLSCYPTKSGEAKLKLVVMSYEVKQMREGYEPNVTTAPSGKAFPAGVKFEEDTSEGILPF